MNLQTINKEVKITLKEITDLISVEHNKAMKVVEKLCEEPSFGGVEKLATPTYNPDGTINRYVQTYSLTKKQAIATGAKLNNSLLMKVIDRLEELESKNNKPLSYEELMQNALLLADKKVKELALENKALNNVIQEQKPKVAFANSVSASNDSILIGAFAKAISTDDFAIGQHRMFNYLRDKGYLMSFGASHNLPKQKYIDNGYFEVSQRTINNPNGTIKLVLTTKITGKGQIALYKKLKEEYKLQQIGA